jgi:hypothetical protein
VNGSGGESMWFVDDAAVAVSICVVLLASFASTVSVVVVGSVAVYKLLSGAVITTLGGNVARVAVFAFAAIVLDAVITVFTAAIFALGCAFSHHFFFWLRLPCPGPGMLVEVR